MKKDVKILLSAIILLILVLGLFTWWHYRELQKAISEGVPIAFDLDAFMSDEREILTEESFREFLVPDGDLKITYAESWQEIDPLAFSIDALDTEKMKTLFFTTKTELASMKIGWLMVQQLKFEEEAGFEEIIEEIKVTGEDQGVKTEIKNLDIGENTAEFEISQSLPGYATKGKGRIIFTEKNIYSVIIFSFFNDWNFFREEAGQILNSTQVLPAE